MITILLAIIISLEILIYLIIFDIILSWLSMIGIKWRPNFLSGTIDPIYNFIRKIIPTKIGVFDLTPIIIFIIISFIKGIIFTLFPEVQIEYFNLISK